MSTPSVLRRTLGNFSVLMGGRAVAGIISVVAVALAARILGPTQFGVLVLVHTAAMVVRGLVNFKPSDTMVRYGVASFDARERSEFASLLRFGLALDALTATLSALLLLLLIVLAGTRLGLPAELEGPAALYALALLASGTGTARGVLRLAGRFDVISVQQTVAPLVRLGGIGVAYLVDAGVAGYVVIWAMASLAEYVYINLRGLRELHTQGYALQRPELGSGAQQFGDIWRFVWTLYWQSNLELAQRHGLILLAGALLGPAGAGMFRIAREFADVLAKPVVVVRQAVFPDLARLSEQADAGEFRRLYVKLGVLGGGIALAVVGFIAVYGAEVLSAVVGESYVHGAAVLTWLMLAAAIDFSSAALRPAAYALGAATAAFRAQLIGAAINVALFLVLVPGMGLPGAGVAAVAGSAVVMALMIWLLSRLSPGEGS